MGAGRYRGSLWTVEHIRWEARERIVGDREGFDLGLRALVLAEQLDDLAPVGLVGEDVSEDGPHPVLINRGRIAARVFFGDVIIHHNVHKEGLDVRPRLHVMPLEITEIGVIHQCVQVAKKIDRRRRHFFFIIHGFF